MHSKDDIFTFPLTYKPRSVPESYWWLGQFANGSTVQSGVYKYVPSILFAPITPWVMIMSVLANWILASFRVAALRPFGDRKLSGDWDIYKTPKITVKLEE